MIHKWWSGLHVQKVQIDAEKERKVPTLIHAKIHQVQKEIQGGEQRDNLFRMQKAWTNEGLSVPS